ncbi:hypothetical protein [Pareuzebyella sediminis]|uniref:hypothetical protein n=1 Tax=Pareuzebyella sediminis TaxID=2607998 RepID=UPI0011EC1FF6|nr:hypothetical protein [Pareuzebyella sediminis]
MHKKFLSLTLLALCCSLYVLRAQRTEKGNTFDLIDLERHQVSFNLLMPSLQYEIGIARNVSASAIVGLGLATPQEGYSLAPIYNVKARFYHNFERRKALNKNVAGNSGNYIAASYTHFFTEWELLGNMNTGDSSLDFIGAAYGLQRTFGNGINFSVEAGGGWYRRHDFNLGMGPVIGFSLGWTPTKRKSRKPRFD